VTGRWAGTNRVQVQLADGSYAQVESATNNADEVNPGERVLLVLDEAGSPAGWALYGPER
jgi:hypothetical protein